MGCQYVSSSQQLQLLVGSNAGTLCSIPLLEQAGPDGALLGARLACPSAMLHGQHSAVVRAAHHFEAAGGPMCATGGEDGLVCLWNLASHSAAGTGTGTGAGVAGGGGGGSHSPVVMDTDMGRGPEREHDGTVLGKPHRKRSPY